MKSTSTGRRFGRSIYGVIITATLLITLENYEDSAWDMIATIVFTLLAVAISEYYATLFEKGFENRSKLKREELLEIFVDCLYMFYGSLIPILIFLLAAFGIMHTLTAFNLAEATVSLLLVMYGYLYGRIGGHSQVRSLLYGLGNFGLVAGIVLIKSLTHH